MVTITAQAFSFIAEGQNSVCPPNIDFELGNLNNWECRTGKVESLNGVNTVTWMGTGVNPDNHKIIPRATAGNDIFGHFPLVSPNGSEYCVKLGNNFLQNISAEGMFYTFSIPDTANLFSVLFYYAVVFQDPQHSPDEQPRFRTRVFNVTDNEIIGCSNFDFTASASLPGFKVSTVDSTVIYKEWTPVTLNLSGYSGKTIRLEFITSDCTFTGHFGYAYIDVNSTCSGAITGGALCPGTDSVTLTAPHGFQSYTWYADHNYSAVLSNNQTLVLSPPPPDGTVFPVVVGPYAGFGCPDTIHATIRTAALPVADAGQDVSVCKGNQAQIGGLASGGHSYSWSPASLLNNPTTAFPLTVPNLTAPVDFYLTVTDDLTGCRSYDTVKVSPVIMDTALQVTGDTVFCSNKTVNTQLRLLTNTGTIQWFQNNVSIPGANSNLLNPQPLENSIYWATITDGNCFDRTRSVSVKRVPVPVAGFTAGSAAQCVNVPFQVLNSSSEPAGANNYLWVLSDGRIFTDKNPSFAFSHPGNYSVKLRATSPDGCSDSIVKSVQVVGKCAVYVPAAFTPNDDGRNELFKPIFFGVLKLKRFTIYDRGGYIVFSTSKPGEGWDGMHQGKKVPSSVLVWVLEYENSDGKPVLQKGTVALIR